jgi:hypothetical protein
LTAASARARRSAQIAFGIRTVLHHGSAADDFELRDFGEIIEYFVLHAVSEVGVVFVRTDVLEW